MVNNVDVVPESTYLSQLKERQRELWLGLLTGPVVYALYFIIGYLLVEYACQTESLLNRVGGLPLVSVLVLALTLVAILITLTAGLANFRRWRQHNQGQAAAPVAATVDVTVNVTVDNAVPFMLFGGMLLSMLFTTLILLTGLPLFVLQSCRWI